MKHNQNSAHEDSSLRTLTTLKALRYGPIKLFYRNMELDHSLNFFKSIVTELGYFIPKRQRLKPRSCNGIGSLCKVCIIVIYRIKESRYLAITSLFCGLNLT